MRLFLLFLIAAAAHAQGLIREEQTIDVNGMREVWRLQWKSPPKPACDAADPSWYTCPCIGFAFGETGELGLVRLRQGREVERFPLNPLFEEQLIVQRWAIGDKDMDDRDSDTLTRIVAKRPAVRLMYFGDYDHDGHATEFYLQTHASPCVHAYGVIVGVSPSNPRLHAFSTASHPDKPLVLQKQEWDALLKAQGPVHIEDWTCGDHGSDIQIELQLAPDPRGIHVTREEYACPRVPNAHPRKTEQQ